MSQAQLFVLHLIYILDLKKNLSDIIKRHLTTVNNNFFFS